MKPPVNLVSFTNACISTRSHKGGSPVLGVQNRWNNSFPGKREPDSVFRKPSLGSKCTWQV
eukprot:6486441-Amphidinium_carterae.1